MEFRKTVNFQFLDVFQKHQNFKKSLGHPWRPKLDENLSCCFKDPKLSRKHKFKEFPPKNLRSVEFRKTVNFKFCRF